MTFLKPQFSHGALLKDLHGFDGVRKQLIPHRHFIAWNVVADLICCLRHAGTDLLRQLLDECLWLIRGSGHVCKKQAQQFVMHQLHCEKAVFVFVHSDISLCEGKV